MHLSSRLLFASVLWIGWSVVSTLWLLEPNDVLFDSSERMKMKEDDSPSTHASAPSKRLRGPHDGEFVFWQFRKTYSERCRKDILGNADWGKSVAPLVDKLEAKEIVRQWSPSVHIIPTYAHLDESNVTLIVSDPQFLNSLPQPYIIKPTHTSGNVAEVANDTYSCLKTCKDKNLRISANGVSTTAEFPTLESRRTRHRALHRAENGVRKKIMHRAKDDLAHDYSAAHNEMQYASLHRRIVFEQKLDMKVFRDVTCWFLAGGVPVFVSLECARTNGSVQRSFFSTGFQRLPMKLSSQPCTDEIEKPGAWDLMHQIASEIAIHVPNEIVRLDLYASETQVAFSELTFTTTACKTNFFPIVADGLLFALNTKEVDPTAVTAEFVEEVISGTSWVKVEMDPFVRRPKADRGYPSPVDLCYTGTRIKVFGQLPGNFLDAECIREARALNKDARDRKRNAHPKQSKPLRCLVVTNDGQPSKGLAVEKAIPWSQVFMEHVDIDRVVTLAAILLVLYKFPNLQGKHPKQNRIVKFVLCLVGMAAFMYIRTNHNGFSSGQSLQKIVGDSFYAFQMVHPMASTWVVLSHLATYWFLVAAWFSRDLKTTIVWFILYETVTASVNEYTHHREEDNPVHCMRAVFIDTMRNYVLDDLIRWYILPPFFVYGYLLPKFLWHTIF
jgi:hypothetical protein